MSVGEHDWSRCLVYVLPERVKKKKLRTGFYWVMNSSLGLTAHVKITSVHGVLTVWGLSRYQGVVDYRTLGKGLGDWLREPENKRAKFYTDIDWASTFEGELEVCR